MPQTHFTSRGLPIQPCQLGNSQDLVGRNFGRLTVTTHLGRVRSKGGHSRHYWLSVCSCGGESVTDTNSLRHGRVASCGCLMRETSRKTCQSRATHGHSVGRPTKTYHTWYAMVRRCRPDAPYRANYYDRGIKVCRRWKKFENFLADMGEKPEGMQLDRRDNNKGYNKRNCRWTTCKENQRNRSDNRLLTYNNETLCLAAWAERKGLKATTLKSRLLYGWSVAEALNTPIGGKRAA